MKLKLLTFLATLFLVINSFGASTMTPSIGDLPIVVAAVSNLTKDVAALSNVVVSAGTNLQIQINTETNRAYSSETNLQAQINTESNRAHAVETNLQAQLNIETNRAYSSETNLQAQIRTETNRAYKAETNILNDLASTAGGSEGILKVGALGGYTLFKLLQDTGVRGPAKDYPVFTYAGAPTVNLNVSWTIGDVYSPVEGYYHIVANSNTLTDNSVNYAYWNISDPTAIKWTTTRPNVDSNIVLAVFSTAFGMVIGYSAPEASSDFPMNTRAGAAHIAPSLIVEGMTHYAIGTNLNDIIMVGGTEYQDMRVAKVHEMQDLRNPTQTIAIVVYAHTNVGCWGYSLTNKFPIGLWDDNTNVVACDTNSWYKGLFVSMSGSPMMHYISPQQAYTSEVDAIAGADPALPPGFTPYVPLCTEYVFKGDDTTLRTESTYWVDRRFQIRRPGSSVITGGTALTPSLTQVMLQGSSLGGILPHDAGLPTLADQLANKDYVDSIRNKACTGTAFVDPVNGDDILGRVEQASTPFKTIQAAVDACVAVPASDTRRFLVSASIGVYNEDVTMHNFVSVRGMDTESTIINGQFYYPPAYTDIVGGELAVLSIFANNRPALRISMGNSLAYSAARSCAIYSTWTNASSVKPTVQIERGMYEVYATTWVENDTFEDDGGTGVVCLFYGTTNANLGTFRFTDYSGSHTIKCTDTNDDVSICYSDAAQHNYMEIIAAHTSIVLDDSTNHVNKIKLGFQNGGNGSLDMKSCLPTIDLNCTNACDVILGVSQNTPVARTGSGIHYTASRVRAPNIKIGRAFTGSAPGSNDYVEAFWDALAPQTTVNPVRYTADGTAGIVSYILGHNSGDLLLSGGIDLSSDNTANSSPEAGHGRLYIQTTSGLENPYFLDSAGIALRNFRDSSQTMYNAETNTLVRGETVYVPLGINGTANYCKRAKADNLATMPCVGFVASSSIAAGSKGRIFVGGRIETGVDTSYMTAGQKIYLSAINEGKFTNVAPTSGYVQNIGYANVIGTNGSVLIAINDVDTLGNQLPSNYESTNNVYQIQTNLQAQINAETNRAYSSETNLQAQIRTETNRAYSSETNLQAQINAETNRAYSSETNLQAQMVIVSNAFVAADSNLQNHITIVSNMVGAVTPVTVAFDAYVTNGWSTANGTVTMPFVSNVTTSSSIFSNSKFAFTPQTSGWYKVSASVVIDSNQHLTLTLSRCNTSATNTIQTGGGGNAANTPSAVLSSMFYNTGSTNWYIVRLTDNAVNDVVGGTTGSTRFNGYLIGK